VTDNLQDYIYTLAVKKLYPKYKDVKMEFVFLKAMQSSQSSSGKWQIVGSSNSVLTMRSKTEDELKGFEYELTDFQSYAENFTQETSKSNLAFKQGMPKDGSFSGRLLCGFAKKPNELKKDGSPKWYCSFKFPFDYYSVIDEKKQIKRSFFTEKEATKYKQKKDKITKLHYTGCPLFNKPATPPPFERSSEIEDEFDLDKF